MDEQPRVTDLVPRSLVSIALVLTLGVLLIIGLELAYAWMPLLAPLTSDGRVAALDLDGEGSLGAWFSSTLLILSGLVALVILSVRRLKADDYHGRYRIWLWVALAWIVMGIDEAASLHEGFKELMRHLTGTRLYGDGSVWWIGAYLIVLSYVGVRLWIEIRDSTPSRTCLALTAVCWTVAIVLQLGLFMADGGARQVMVEEGAEMVGYLMLLLTMIVHARHVIEEAEGGWPERETTDRPARTGLLRRRRKAAVADESTRVKRAKSKKSSSESPDEKRRWFRRRKSRPAVAEADQAKAGQTKAKEDRKAAAESASSAKSPKAQIRIDSLESPEPTEKLTRAERKKLRKQRRNAGRSD